MWDAACVVCVLVEGGERKKTVEGRTAKLSCVLTLYYVMERWYTYKRRNVVLFQSPVMDICTAANFCVQRGVKSEYQAFSSSLRFVLLLVC